MHRFFATLRMTSLLIVCLVSSFAQSAQEDPNQKADAIRKVMNAQVAAWNKGDLEGYMDGYWCSPDLEFYSGTTITKGWDATLERYKKRYQQGGNEMGKLDFSELAIHTNPSDIAWVTGKWHLKMKDGSDRGGLFTLIFRKTPTGWKITHDHTS
jgi:ketosteroid isomerase-like protein